VKPLEFSDDKISVNFVSCRIPLVYRSRVDVKHRPRVDLVGMGGLDRMGLLQVFEVYPRGGAIFPLAAKLLTNGRALKVCLSISVDSFLVR
jgi:hypothetical protein